MRANNAKKLCPSKTAKDPQDQHNLSQKKQHSHDSNHQEIQGTELTGTVISRYGQHADIESEDGTQLRCNIRRTISSLVTGDKVMFKRVTDSQSAMEGIVEAVYPRHSSLTRPDLYDGLKIIAANIDQVLIVSSVLPSFSTQIIDRYLVAAEDTEITPVILLNKTDLLTEENQTQIELALKRYQNIGYEVHKICSKSGEGVSEIQGLLDDKISIVAGQSGVGKSSFINSLLPDSDLITADVSTNSGLGQHTTTTAKLIHIPSGGSLIDSPGVREFALWHLPAQRVGWGFIEFREFLGSCKFRDCKHDKDPGCALNAAHDQGLISSDRLNNYHKIIASLGEQKHARHFRTQSDE